MSFLNFESITGSLNNLAATFSNYGMKIKYGVNYDIKSEFTGNGTTKGERRGALFSNHVTSLGYIRTNVIEDQDVFDGFNKTMLGENGSPDYDLMSAAITKLYDTERDGGPARTMLASSVKNDNCVTIIYNMLRLYTIKKMQRARLANIKPGDVIYDDGHVQVNAAAFLGITEEHNIQQFATAPIDNIGVFGALVRGATLDGGDVLVLNVEGMNANDQTVIQLAAAEWPDNDMPFRVCHPVFSCANVNVMAEHATKVKDVVGFSDLSPEQILLAIQKFVTNMRVQAHFDMAYALLCQTMYTHLPRSVEAFIWYSKRQVIKLAKSRSARGIHPLFTAGQPFVVDVSRWATFKSHCHYPDRAILHSIALSEAVMTSMFDYMTRDPDEEDIMYTVVGGGYVKDTALMRDLYLASMRFGYTMDMPWPSQVGVQRYNWMDDQIMGKLMVVNVLDALAPETYAIVKRAVNGVETSLVRLTEIVPACYPLLSMGIRASRFYMNELEMEVELNYNKRTGSLYTSDAYAAHRAMAIWRVMGWDVTARRRSDAAFFTNWAPNANGHYIPAFIDSGEIAEVYEFRAETIAKRGYNWCEMPNVQEKLHMKISMQYVVHKMYVDNVDVRTFGPAVVPKHAVAGDGEVKILGDKIRYSKFEVKGVDAVQKMAGFRMIWETGLTVADAELFTGHTL